MTERTLILVVLAVLGVLYFLWWMLKMRELRNIRQRREKAERQFQALLDHLMPRPSRTPEEREAWINDVERYLSERFRR